MIYLTNLCIKIIQNGLKEFIERGGSDYGVSFDMKSMLIQKGPEHCVVTRGTRGFMWDHATSKAAGA